MKLSLTGKNAEQFTAALWNKIVDTGFNSLSKNDFYDYVLYLFDKYNDIHFLAENSDYANSVMLRVTPQKLRNSRQNIFLKFAEAGEKNMAVLFFSRIADGKITLALNPQAGEYALTVDDPALRNYLDDLMKRTLGKTFDYKENPENIVIKVADFYRVFAAALAEFRSVSADSARIEQNIKALQKSANTKMLINTVAGVIGKAINLSPVGAEQIIEAAKGLIK